MVKNSNDRYSIVECDLEHPYRYSLTVETQCKGEKILVVIQCNPSVAKFNLSDATVGKVSIWAEEYGFGRVIFLNLFAYISPRISDLVDKPYDYLVGPRNNEVLASNIGNGAIVVLAWGGDLPLCDYLYKRRLGEIKNLLDVAGVQPYHVGSLVRGRFPRHGRRWNEGNRELSVCRWDSILR